MIRAFAPACLLAAAASLPAPAGADDLAARFGARPGIEHASLSPDGSKLAYVVPRDGQGSAILVQETREGAKARLIAAVNGNPDRLAGCNWVSEARLVCRLHGVVRRPVGGVVELLGYARSFAIDSDGGNQRLLERQRNDRSRGLALDSGVVIDWLPDESNAVLMARTVLPDDNVGSRIGSAAQGLGVERVDTATLRATRAEPPARMPRATSATGAATSAS
ncbi:MAG: hypothetical protein SNJ79_04830 [Sphingomonadaceae bacterium]